jgi:hypothetical protein
MRAGADQAPTRKCNQLSIGTIARDFPCIDTGSEDVDALPMYKYVLQLQIGIGSFDHPIELFLVEEDSRRRGDVFGQSFGPHVHIVTEAKPQRQGDVTKTAPS